MVLQTPEMSISTSLATPRERLETFGTRLQSLGQMDSSSFCPLWRLVEGAMPVLATTMLRITLSSSLRADRISLEVRVVQALLYV